MSAEKRTRFDGWLAGICASRVFNGLVFMSYAAALPVLQREWGMSAAQAGLIASGFQIGYAVSLVVFSSVADRISPKRLYLWSLFAAGVFSLSFAVFARGFTSALILHTVVGISLGGTYTTGVMIIADQYVARHRGMAVGFFIASTSCGYAFSLAISGVAIPVGGYKLSFLLTCLGPMLGWFLAWITLRRTAVPAPGRRKEQRFTREVLGNRPAMLLIWGYTCHNWELLGMWSWTPAFLAACLALTGSTEVSAAGYGAFITALVPFCGPSGLVFHGDPLRPHGPRQDPAGPGGREHGLLLPVRLVRGVAPGAGGGNRRWSMPSRPWGTRPSCRRPSPRRWTLLTWVPPSVSDRWWGSAPGRWRRSPLGPFSTGPIP